MVWAIRAGVPLPPYTRQTALIVETVGRRSGRRHRLPVGYLEEDGRLVVVVEHGARAQWVQNALARDGRLRVFFRGSWRAGRLRLSQADPEPYLRRMSPIHAVLVRRNATRPAVATIELEPVLI